LGPLFIGKNFVKCYVVYDTMSPWTIITGTYDKSESETSSQWF